MLPELASILALFASPPQNDGPCDLVDHATVVGLLGPTSTAGVPAGPEPDEDTDGTVRYCTFKAGTAAMILSQVTFLNATAAAKATTKQLVSSRMEGDGTTIAEEPGLGDKAYWAFNAEGAEFVVLKGSVVLGMALGGQLPKPPASYKKALRVAAEAALLKL